MWNASRPSLASSLATGIDGTGNGHEDDTTGCGGHERDPKQECIPSAAQMGTNLGERSCVSAPRERLGALTQLRSPSASERLRNSARQCVEWSRAQYNSSSFPPRFLLVSSFPNSVWERRPRNSVSHLPRWDGNGTSETEFREGGSQTEFGNQGKLPLGPS